MSKAEDTSKAARYNQGGIECIDVLNQLEGDGVGSRLLNVVRYIWRIRHKGGAESLYKCLYYILSVLLCPGPDKGKIKGLESTPSVVVGEVMVDLKRMCDKYEVDFEEIAYSIIDEKRK